MKHKRQKFEVFKPIASKPIFRGQPVESNVDQIDTKKIVDQVEDDQIEQQIRHSNSADQRYDEWPVDYCFYSSARFQIHSQCNDDELVGAVLSTVKPYFVFPNFSVFPPTYVLKDCLNSFVKRHDASGTSLSPFEAKNVLYLEHLHHEWSSALQHAFACVEDGKSKRLFVVADDLHLLVVGGETDFHAIINMNASNEINKFLSLSDFDMKIINPRAVIRKTTPTVEVDALNSLQLLDDNVQTSSDALSGFNALQTQTVVLTGLQAIRAIVDKLVASISSHRLMLFRAKADSSVVTSRVVCDFPFNASTVTVPRVRYHRDVRIPGAIQNNSMANILEIDGDLTSDTICDVSKCLQSADWAVKLSVIGPTAAFNQLHHQQSKYIKSGRLESDNYLFQFQTLAV